MAKKTSTNELNHSDDDDDDKKRQFTLSSLLITPER